MQEDGSLKTRIKIKTAVVLSASVILGLAGGRAALAADAGQPSAADTLIARYEQALHAAQSFQADFDETDTYPTKYKDLAQRGSITLERPGDLRLAVKRYRRVSSADPWAASGNDVVENSDGTTYTYAFLHPHSALIRQDSPQPATLEGALKLLPPAAGFFAATTPNQFAGQDGDASLLAPQKWEGDTYQVIQYPVQVAGGREAVAQAYIGQDNLVHRLIYTAQSPSGDVVREWTLHNIVVNGSVSASAFRYTPPAGAAVANSTERQGLLEEGAPAPDFTVTDSQGHPVKLSDYRGKTVILHFWATWCWPCNQSLPHVESVAEANRDSSVVVLAVAIWDSKAGFDHWIAAHHYPNINFAVDPRPEGQDVASSLYHVSVTPTTYVIGPDGNVARTLVGYEGPTGELEAAVAAAQPEKSASGG